MVTFVVTNDYRLHGMSLIELMVTLIELMVTHRNVTARVYSVYYSS